MNDFSEAPSRAYAREQKSAETTDKWTNGRINVAPENVSPSQVHADTGDSLGSPVSVSQTDADLDVSDAHFADLDVPGADPDDHTPPVVVASTEAHVEAAQQFFEQAKAGESAEQVKRARTRSRVFSVMQYLSHPDSGVPMFSQEQLDAGLAALADSTHRSAYIWHDSDRLVAVDDGTLDVICTGLKGLHMHLMLWCTEDRPTIRTVSDALQIPSARVRVPREVAAQGGGADHKGRNAAEKAFYDLAEYLVHETRGKDGLRGTQQPERFYLVDKDQPGNPGKYQYGRGRVVANFDFSHDLEAHMAGRANAVAAEGGSSLTRRKRRLRRLVSEGTTLDEAEALDLDAFLDDLPRLEAVRRRWEEKNQTDPAVGLGTQWYKPTILLLGPKGSGKGVIADEINAQTRAVAALAGREWTSVQPPGRNALEGVGSAEIVHHDDLRGSAFPGYDEALRYFDPNRATEAWQRHSRIGRTCAPRLILVSSSETILTLGMGLKTRKDIEQLAITERDPHRRFPALDIDEYLRRIGWVVEVHLPGGLGLELLPATERLATVRREVMASIRRVRMDGERRTEMVASRSGQRAGRITTTHRLVEVGVLKGAAEIARFLVANVMADCSPDVVADVPEQEWALWVTAKALAEQMFAQAMATRQQTGEPEDTPVKTAPMTIETPRPSANLPVYTGPMH